MPPNNDDQIAYWNGPAGARWAANQAYLDPSIQQYGDAAIEAAKVKPGERVLDVGCGAGTTSFALSKLVGPEGEVVGVDISGPMLERARVGVAPGQRLSFLQADASSHDFAGQTFDLVFSRFGVMFFADPVAAFAKIRAALAPGGRLAFVCWRTLPENDWARVPLQASMRAAGIEPDPAAKGAPGPFSLGAPGRVEAVLGEAGFVDVVAERRDFRHRWGVAKPPSLDEGVEAALTYGPGAAVAASAGEAKQPAIRAAVREALEPAFGPEGVLLGSAVYVVTAKRG